ncbi:MAG: L,D-transpeptidase family protein [Legionellales bacterium]|nr:L,D-transpeptidase family protein [Legionellales bacterium]
MNKIILSLLCIFFYSFAFATDYPLPKAGNDIIGQVYTVKAQANDNFDNISRRYDIGYFELVEANPHIKPFHIPENTEITIPAQFILPAVREGIVINLAELRMYYFPKDKPIVETFPIGIGSIGQNTPPGNYYVAEKIKNPVWHPPKSVRENYLQRNIVLPKDIPSNDSNPLGYYALRLSIWTYLIHGTNEPESVGKRSSAGCIHLFPEDIEYLFNQAEVRTPVHIINDFYKLGWRHHQLYLEVEQPLHEEQVQARANLTPLVAKINQFTDSKKVSIDWPEVTNLAQQQNGMPTVISQ